MVNIQATSPVSAYTVHSWDMLPPIHRYNTQTKPKANVSIQKTNSHKPNNNLKPFNAVINPATGATIEYRDLIINPTMKIFWTRSIANDFGKLAKGVGTRMKT